MNEFIGFDARLIVGGLLLVAALGKLLVAQDTTEAAAVYGIDGRLSRGVIRILPFAEFLLSLGLLTGAWLEAVVPTTGVLLAVFTVIAAQAILRGKHGECHCFSGLMRERLGWELWAVTLF